MSVEIAVTITAKNPPSLDLNVEMPGPKPTDLDALAEWIDLLEHRAQDALGEVDSYGSGYDGYIAEFINEYAGGWEITQTQEMGDPS